MRMSKYLFWFASPARFAPLADRLVVPSLGLAALLALVGLWLGFGVVPADAVQGEGYRILYLHVPASWMAMLIYAAMAFWGGVGLVWRTRLSFLMAHALAPTGAWFAFLSLVTGALWGQPMWGTWWVWDARLTLSLLLLFLYLGYLLLLQAHEDRARADQACALLAVLGVVNLPLLYFSVRWWNTLHQGASVTPGHSAMATPMLVALLFMCAAAWCYTLGTSLYRVQLLIQDREVPSDWDDPGPHTDAAHTMEVFHA